MDVLAIVGEGLDTDHGYVLMLDGTGAGSGGAGARAGTLPGFGLGFWVITDLGYSGELGTSGSYGWGSAYYPQYFVDPKEHLIAFFLTQLTPAGSLDLNQRFRPMVYQALVK